MDKGTVYILACAGGPYKIGKTRGSVADRMKVLSTGCPFELTLAHQIPCMQCSRTEAAIHRALKPKLAKLKGEWFWLSKDDLKWLRTSSEDDIIPRISNKNTQPPIKMEVAQRASLELGKFSILGEFENSEQARDAASTADVDGYFCEHLPMWGEL